jgi:hypothetical protein
MVVYILDSNFFIEAHRVSYPVDVAYSFWNKVKQLAENGIVISIDKVRNEIYDRNDALEEWCKNNLPADFFRDSSEVMAEYGIVSGWAISKSNHYLPNAINEFLDADEADAFLVAYALANASERTIVTQEISEPNRKNRVKIPEACNDLNVQYVNTINMFRNLGETF